MPMYSKQFEGIWNLVETVQASVTVASTAAGASTVTGNITPTASTAAVGDIVLLSNPVTTAGAVLTATVTAAGTLVVSCFNPTGGSTYNPGAQTMTFYILRAAPLVQ